jgi:hypothetical protein
MKYVVWALVPFCLAMAGCSGGTENEDKIKTYFDVQSLFVGQPTLLRNLTFTKKANIDGQSEEKAVSFDSLGWAKELAMFANMDINKAVYVGAYEIEETKTEKGKEISYKRKPGTVSGVVWITVEFDKQGNPLRFSGLFQEQNALYQNERKLSADFALNNGKAVLSSYTIKGYQKILMKDTVQYKIELKRAG